MCISLFLNCVSCSSLDINNLFLHCCYSMLPGKWCINRASIWIIPVVYTFKQITHGIYASYLTTFTHLLSYISWQLSWFDYKSVLYLCVHERIIMCLVFSYLRTLRLCLNNKMESSSRSYNAVMIYQQRLDFIYILHFYDKPQEDIVVFFYIWL